MFLTLIKQYLIEKSVSGETFMRDLLRYMSSAPVLAAIWITVTAGILIEFNRFFPDLLFHPM